MAEQNFPDNILYEMDNIDVLRGMNSETVDLIATDPPFNTKRNRAGTAGSYVDNWKWGDETLPDQWKWANLVHPIWLEEIRDTHPALFEVIEAAQHSHSDDLAAFLCFLSVRLIEMHRLLKPTGSIYLHCDHSAGHYIKLCMDAVFGAKNLKNEIIWFYKAMSAAKKYFPRKHDTIFWYSKSDKWTFNADAVREPYDEKTVKRYEKPVEFPGGYVAKKNELGRIPYSVWEIPPIRNVSKEKTGSPDQKPLALYERIIKASSNEGDIVLDPFAGCATTPVAAKNLNRRFIGIDRRMDFAKHVYNRMSGEKLDTSGDADFVDIQEWINGINRLGIHYSNRAPVRTDDKGNAPDLPAVYTVKRATMKRSEMMQILTDKFSVVCWGCGFEPPSVDYLDLDHVLPVSEGGSNELHNRAVLCAPCNRRKGNRITLTALRRENSKAGKWYGNIPIDKRIDLRAAREWCQTEELMR